MPSSTPLLPGVNHFISLEKAKEMTALFRAEKENILVPELRNQHILTICETFNREVFDALLAETDCVGLRIYFGMDPGLKVKVIAVGVNGNNQDILPPNGSPALTQGNGVLGEEGVPCPPLCPDPPL
jgi:hypothetical protein